MESPLSVDNRQSGPRIALLTLGAFAIGTDGFVIAGLLPKFAATYHVSLSIAGQLVTAYALSFAILSPILATFTCHFSREKILVVGLSVFAIANLAGALCTHFTDALLARVLAGAAAGLFTPTASAVATALVGPSRKNRALATIMLGLSIATAVGSPLGVFISTYVSWRVILAFISMLAASLALAILYLFPSLDLPPALSLRDRVRPVKSRRVALVLVSTFLVLTGLYITYTYSSVVFGIATSHQAKGLSFLLFVWGVGAIAGSILGRSADWFGERLIVNVVLAALVLDFCFIFLAGTTFMGAVVGVTIWGICGWAFVIPQQHRLIAAAPHLAPVLIGLHLTAVYAGTSLSGIIGAVALRLVSPISLTLISAALIACGWTISELLFAIERNNSSLRGLCVPKTSSAAIQ